MIKQKDLKYENPLCYYKGKLFTGLSVDNDGNKFWHKKGKLHRKDGPATEYINGDKEWYKKGKLHRETGPAIEYCINSDFYNAGNYWYKEDKKHRLDGPAVECHDGSLEWWFEDNFINCNSQTEFEIYLRAEKIKVFK